LVVEPVLLSLYLSSEITPYYHLNRVVNRDCFSIASYLKKYGYYTVSLHTHDGKNQFIKSTKKQQTFL